MATEADAIAAAERPATVASITQDLQALGLEAGDVVIAHSSLSALGWVAGGAQAVVEALLGTVGPDGTVVMPTQSGQLSDPAAWSNPPVPEAWFATIRRELPAFDPHLTPTRGMGQVVECFRQHPGTRRSDHPTVSFAANGPAASRIVGSHPLSPGLGETSPLGRLYELDAKVLLLGVTHANNTSLHLAEHRAEFGGKTMTSLAAPVVVAGQRTWVEFEDLEPDDSDFVLIGERFTRTGAERTGAVGAGRARLCSQRAVVDFGATWMARHRTSGPT